MSRDGVQSNLDQRRLSHRGTRVNRTRPVGPLSHGSSSATTHKHDQHRVCPTATVVVMPDARGGQRTHVMLAPRAVRTRQGQPPTTTRHCDGVARLCCWASATAPGGDQHIAPSKCESNARLPWMDAGTFVPLDRVGCITAVGHAMLRVVGGLCPRRSVSLPVNVLLHSQEWAGEHLSRVTSVRRGASLPAFMSLAPSTTGFSPTARGRLHPPRVLAHG